MKKVALFTLLGMVLIFGGIIVLYLYLDSLKDSNNFILLVASLLLIAGSVYSFVIANKPPKTNAEVSHIFSDDGENTLERNNALYNDFKKTSNTRNRLQVMKSASDKNVI